MLERTNIYLPRPTIQFYKRRAEHERVPMAKLVRKILEKEMRNTQNHTWATLLLSIAKKAGRSKLADLSKNHDRYLLQSSV